MLRMLAAITLMLGIQVPIPGATRYGLQPNDAGVLLPRLTKTTSQDPSWCGEFIVHHASRSVMHMVTLRFVVLGDENELETITLDHDLVRPHLDPGIGDRPLFKLIQMIDPTKPWIDVWMNQKQLDEATCLEK